jgi:hypothetical protein
MSMKIWLTAKAVSQAVGTGADSKLYGTKVETSKESNGRYVTLYLNPIDPAVDMPRFPRGHVKAITFCSDKYYHGFRHEGVYQLKGAKALVKTEVHIHNADWDHKQDASTIARYQEISISAGSIKTLREIYTQIRQGKLQPTETWSNGGREGVSSVASQRQFD